MKAHRVLALSALLAAPTALAGADFDAAVSLLRDGEAARARAAFEQLAAEGEPRARDALAAMLLKGIGGPADPRAALGWYCLLAHHPPGGREVVHALWFLAEYFRTGGAFPGREWNAGRREREDPVRAYFWYSLLADQERFYEQVLGDGVRLGRIGRDSMARQLYAAEKQQVERRLARWTAAASPASGAACLRLPAD